jgi:HPt (histidine-containing phosphotransfer) domain-containing protein
VRTERQQKQLSPGIESRAEAPASALDGRALDRLRRQGGDDLLREIIAVFLEDAPKRIRSARAGAEGSDLDKTRRAAHSLKSSAATLGAVRLQELSERIELLATKRRSAAVAALLDDWEAAFAVACGRLKAVAGPDDR